MTKEVFRPVSKLTGGAAGQGRAIRLRVFFTKIDDVEELIIASEQFLFLRLLVRNPTNAAVLDAIKSMPN
jgi:hypothetical protein